MNIDENIMKLYSSDAKEGYQSLKELTAHSTQSNEAYAYMDQFIEMMSHPTNSFIRTRGLRLFAYQAKWDTNNLISAHIQTFLKHIEDEVPITARQCIQDCVIIAKYKPACIDTMLEALNDYQKVYSDSMQSLIYKDRQTAIRKIKQYTW